MGRALDPIERVNVNDAEEILELQKIAYESELWGHHT